MSNARNLANLLGTGTQIKTDKVADEVFQANDSLIINGDMAVAQRGTSSTGVTTAGYYTVDRFRWYSALADTVTLTQSSEAPNGFRNSFKVEVTTADSDVSTSGDRAYIYQVIEAQNLQHLQYGTSDAKKITVSFWVRSSVTGTYSLGFYQQDGDDLASLSYTIDTADTWEYKTMTLNGNTAASIDDNNGWGIAVYWWFATNTQYTGGSTNAWVGSGTETNWAADHAVNVLDTVGNDFYLTGVKFEIGDTATPFKHLSYAENLHQCRRYYQELTGWGKVFHVNSSSAAYAMFEFNPEMRATPTLTATTTDFRFYSGGDVETISQMNLQNITNRQFQFYLQGSGFNAGRAGHLDSRSNKFYTAEAEL